MTGSRRKQELFKRATTRRFASTIILLLASPVHSRPIAAARNRSESSAPCLDRAFRRLWKTNNNNIDAPSSCEQPHLATDFCHGPPGASCLVVDNQHGHRSAPSRTGPHPRRPGPDTCSLVTHALWVEAHFGNDWTRHERDNADIVVVIPAGTCQGPMRQGPFRQEWLERNQTVINQPVVSLQLNGSHLLTLLERNLELRHVLMQRDAQPRVSGMQFWVRPRRNVTRISRPTVLERSSCRWKPVQPSRVYTVVTVPSLVKQSRHRSWMGGIIQPVRVPDESTRGSNASVVLTVVDAVVSYARRACQVGDPSHIVSEILSGGRQSSSAGFGGGRKSREVPARQEPSSPVCAAHSKSKKKKDFIQVNANPANRTYHSRLATW